MRADPNVLGFGLAVTTLVPASVLAAVLRAAWPAPYAMLRKVLVPGAHGEPGAQEIATPAAHLAAFLNAAFGFSLGCAMYLLIRRLLPAAKLEVSQ